MEIKIEGKANTTIKVKKERTSMKEGREKWSFIESKENEGGMKLQRKSYERESKPNQSVEARREGGNDGFLFFLLFYWREKRETE